MKKFNRSVHKSMGELPSALRQLIGDADVATATAEFKDFMTALATEFHAQLSMDIAPPDINLRAPRKRMFAWVEPSGNDNFCEQKL